MRTFVAQGHLKPTDLIWRPGFADWRPAPAVFPFQQPEPAPAQPRPTTQGRRAEPSRGREHRPPQAGSRHSSPIVSASREGLMTAARREQGGR
ncbi:MAG: DUF4339 domain-containing protein [Hyphomicrobium sp.]|nr:DUF4339 domain-containing protein [Hyphomicrobium sp.]